MSLLVSLALAAVRLVIRLYPARFRARFGADVIASVRRDLTEAAGTGLPAVATAAAIGICLGYGGVQLLKAWMPEGIPRIADIAIDRRVLAATIGAAVLTGAIFGSVPAIQAARPDLTAMLRAGGRSSTAGAMLCLVLAALAASALPARRAASVDPMTALRAE
jgi:putative ABC transport system permease protein